ncbi:hypothetical protein CJP72_00570 [Citrobacter sp. NCU1]|uniref:DUF4163 domain-containing protein n=1 Tax=Citrobacter sp. NCU1 TaxID=2026683 RepID=UPI00139104F4|nr:DUF4163 domain-containing protein [Citrobacter sp. NCU1]NDO79307.1 hypothetical protein [Citrobacter sp. NCU1]
MKGCLTGVALWLLSGCAMATQLDIKNLNFSYPESTEIQYRLPWFTSADNPQAAKRINDFIFSRFLNQLPGNDPQATLNKLAKAGIDATANLDYTVVYRDDKILTLNLFVEGCGAYCESYNVPLSFDLASGANITLDDLLTPATIAQLNTRVRKDIRSQIAAFVEQHKSEWAKQINAENGEDFNYEELYASCATYEGGLFYVDKFSLQKGDLVFINGRCSNHASRAMDELGDFTTKIAAATLQDQLTPYGKSLISGQSEKPLSPAPSLNDKLVYGTLGKSMRIVMNIACDDTSASGAYFYEKYGSPIELIGKCGTENLQHYELKTAVSAEVEEKITLDLKDGIYQGVWESNGKTLPIRFE